MYKAAQKTPVIKVTSDPNEKDLSTMAWDAVRDKMDELGKKYGYDPRNSAINSRREVIAYDRQQSKDK